MQDKVPGLMYTYAIFLPEYPYFDKSPYKLVFFIIKIWIFGQINLLTQKILNFYVVHAPYFGTFWAVSQFLIKITKN